MGEDPSGTFVDDLERADHTARTTGATLGIDELHAVDGERRFVVGDEDALVDPRTKSSPGLVVAGRAVAFDRDVDVDDVRRVESSQLASIVLGENVVRGSQDEIEIDPRVAKGAERFEARHVSRLASRQPDRKTPRPEKRGTGKMGV